MKCPHCSVAYNVEDAQHHVGSDGDTLLVVVSSRCPECHRPVVRLVKQETVQLAGGYPAPLAGVGNQVVEWVYPRSATRQPIPAGMPANAIQDYKEACETLSASPKASAALSRRVLQFVLQDKAGASQADLVNQIDHVLKNGDLPNHLKADLDAVRWVGNLAAHPIKEVATGAILEVTPDEAEWTLSVVEALFDHYYVQLVAAAQRRATYDTKLASAARPPLRKP